MYRALSSGFLLLLLACDWAGDPYFGECFLCAPYSNQVMVCPTNAQPVSARREAHAFGDIHCLPATWENAPGAQPGAPLVPDDFRSASAASPSVYTLMSIRR